MSSDLFLAWRYFKPKRNAVSVITLISVIGVGLGVGVLMVVLAVMTGFSDKMKEKLIDTTAHAQVFQMDGSSIRTPQDIVRIVKEQGGAALPVVMSPLLLQKEGRFIPKQLTAFNPEEPAVYRFDLKNVIREGSFSLEKGEMLVSYLTAKEMELEVGDTVLVHSPVKLSKMIKKNKDGKFEAVTGAYLPGEFKISGIFAFEKYDYDKNVVFMNLDDANELYAMRYGTATNVFVWTDDPYHMTDFMARLNNNIPPFFKAMSWQQMNQRLLGVLAVEKNMQLFLLVFIVLVAAFSITNTLITTVIQKTREIGVLKAVGASSGTILRIFLLQGFFVGTIGTGFGLVLGGLFIHYRMAVLEFLRVVTRQEIFPKEIYVFSELPAHIVPSDLVTISLIAVILCTLGGVIPALRAARLDPAGSLRNE